MALNSTSQKHAQFTTLILLNYFNHTILFITIWIPFYHISVGCSFDVSFSECEPTTQMVTKTYTPVLQDDESCEAIYVAYTCQLHQKLMEKKMKRQSKKKDRKRLRQEIRQQRREGRNTGRL